MNRAGLNGLCVAAGVCLLYMLFDPDMISWRERGPGRGQPENAPWPDSTPVPHPAPASLPRTGGRPPARLWPAQVQPPSAPAFSPGPPPPGPDLPRGAPLGSEEGLGCWQGGPGAPFLLTVSPRTLGGSRPLPAHRHTAPSWLRPLVFGWVLGSHGSTLMALLSSRSEGPPSRQRSERQAAEPAEPCWRLRLWQGSRQNCPAESEARAFSTPVHIAGASAWPLQGPSSPPGRQGTAEC